ncbi:MAG: chitobiase/beta-hexosaminidase C-terminal domain-containing protein [Clostridia bacterium]|nr:chitobiase/beta-hexosaminidase C-terminal domain-containing protein [Clostridia bacterium]
MSIVSVFPFAALARERAAEADYEAKRAAYREHLKKDDVTTDDLLIGSWVSFYSFGKDSYEKQLDQMAASGINFNIFPASFGAPLTFDAAHWENVEAQYAKRNMVYLMNGSRDVSSVAPGAAVAKDLAHCIGYYVADEPTGEALPEIGNVTRAYHAADATRYPWTNLYPSYAGEVRLGGTYREHVERYVSLSGAENIEYLSHDFYPFKESGDNLGIFADMEIIRSVAYENGKLKTHAFPQSTRWMGMRMPNIDEMRWNVYAYLAYGFKALSWFCLVCPGSSDEEGEGFSESLIYRDGEIHDQALFDAWGELNWEVRGLSHALMNLDTVHAYHTDEAIAGVEYLPAGYFIAPTDRTQFVISYMEAKDGGAPHVMLFNKSLDAGKTQSFLVDLSSGVTGLEYLDPHTGEYVPVDISGGTLTADFAIGEGKLYRISGNVSETVTVTAPTFDTVGGSYTAPIMVGIEAAEGTEIYYTLDGTYPTKNATRYTAPITLGKAGEIAYHTLRAVSVKGNAISPVCTETYIINAIPAGSFQGTDLYRADTTASRGAWTVTGDQLSLTSVTSAVSNYYVDASRVYRGVYMESTLRFAEGSPINAMAGITVRSAETAGEVLSVCLTKRGMLTVARNGRWLSLDGTGVATDVSADFTLAVIHTGNYLRVEGNGQLLYEGTSDDFALDGYVGVYTEGRALVTVTRAAYAPLAHGATAIQSAVTKITSPLPTVTVKKNTTHAEILALLPASAPVTDGAGTTLEYPLAWELDGIDTGDGGAYTVKGYPVIPSDAPLANPNNLALRATVQILHEPDRTELIAALTLFESLTAAHYSPESWAAAEEFYRGSAALRDADMPQNAITVAAVFLMDRIRALNPTGIDFTALDAAHAALSACDLSGATDEQKSAVAALLSEAAAFPRTGPVTQSGVDALSARLSALQSELTASGGGNSDPEPDGGAPIGAILGAAGGAVALAGAGIGVTVAHKKKSSKKEEKS